MVEKIKKVLHDFKAKFKSRRYFSMWMLTAIVTFLFFIPPLTAFVINAIATTSLSFVVLDQVAYTGLLAWIWAVYLASDYKTKTLGQYMENGHENGEDTPPDEE